MLHKKWPVVHCFMISYLIHSCRTTTHPHEAILPRDSAYRCTVPGSKFAVASHAITIFSRFHWLCTHAVCDPDLHSSSVTIKGSAMLCHSCYSSLRCLLCVPAPICDVAVWCCCSRRGGAHVTLYPTAPVPLLLPQEFFSVNNVVP